MNLLLNHPVIPVVTLEHAGDAVPVAEALLEGGIKVIEVTLRTEAALDAIRAIKKSLPDMLVGAGTVTTPAQWDEAMNAGADFAVSPGTTEPLLRHANGGAPYLPGVCTPSDVMLALAHGKNHLKFFPAEQSGGVERLKLFGSLFPDVAFCPTGGISPSNAQQYLNLPNVFAIGGSWIASHALIKEKNWKEITQNARIFT